MFSRRESKNVGREEYKLGIERHMKQKYSKAEQLLRQSAQQREKVLGAKHKDTLKSKYWLAITLYELQKYAEAEQLLQQSIQQRENVLGAEHEDTLKSKYWLAVTLYELQKYAEAEQLLHQSIQQREKVLGAEHEDTLKSKLLLQEVLLAIAPPVSMNTTVETVASHLGDFFVEGKGGSETKTAPLESDDDEMILSDVQLFSSRPGAKSERYA